MSNGSQLSAIETNSTIHIIIIISYDLLRFLLDAGLLDTITSTADSKDCPGVCVHTLATLICYEVLENVKCPSPTMRCCVEPPPLPANGTVAAVNKVDQTTPTTVSSARPQSVSDIPLFVLSSCRLEFS